MSMKKLDDQSMMDKLSDIPSDFSTAIRSAWRGRERGLAVFAGVFLASLVITTVFAYESASHRVLSREDFLTKSTMRKSTSTANLIGRPERMIRLNGLQCAMNFWIGRR